jgi:small conductance mechanosensitive channel
VTILNALIAPPHAPSPLALARAHFTDALSGDPQVWRELLTSISQFAVNLVIAALILAITLWASRWASRVVRRAIDRLPRKNEADTTLQSFAGSVTRWGVIVVGLIAVLQQLGVQATSILAVLGAASLAIGLALQGALSNVAAGVMILILRPYRVGDVVEINGRSGRVKSLDLFGTFLSDADNLDVFVPNSKVFGEDQALAVLLTCAGADKRVLAKPVPDAKVTALGDSAVTVTLHAWAPVAIYWDVRFDMIKRVKEGLDAAGLSIPYPHQIAVEKAVKSPTAKAAKPPVEPKGKKTPLSQAPSQSS